MEQIEGGWIYSPEHRNFSWFWCPYYQCRTCVWHSMDAVGVACYWLIYGIRHSYFQMAPKPLNSKSTFFQENWPALVFLPELVSGSQVIGLSVLHLWSGTSRRWLRPHTLLHHHPVELEVLVGQHTCQNKDLSHLKSAADWWSGRLRSALHRHQPMTSSSIPGLVLRHFMNLKPDPGPADEAQSDYCTMVNPGGGPQGAEPLPQHHHQQTISRS